MRLVKNYKNKNTQTNKLIISTMSKETTHFFRKKKKGNKPFWNWRWWWSKQKVEAIQKLMQKKLKRDIRYKSNVRDTNYFTKFFTNY